MTSHKDTLINKILRDVINAKGVKFKSISKATNIEYDILICYLTKGQPIPFHNVNKICEYIGIDPNEIYSQYLECKKDQN